MKTFILGLIGLKLWEFVWLRMLKVTIMAYAGSVRKMLKPLL